jgi:DNA-binding CsgD family transcriptional regulator
VSLVVEGFNTAAIATRFNISRYTVHDHLKSNYDKTGVNSRMGLLTSLFAQPA